MSVLRQVFTAIFFPKPSAVVEPSRNMLVPFIGYHTLNDFFRVPLSEFILSGLLRCVLLLPNLDATVRTAVERSLDKTVFCDLYNSPPKFLSGASTVAFVGLNPTGHWFSPSTPHHIPGGLLEISRLKASTTGTVDLFPSSVSQPGTEVSLHAHRPPIFVLPSPPSSELSVDQSTPALTPIQVEPAVSTPPHPCDCPPNSAVCVENSDNTGSTAVTSTNRGFHYKVFSPANTPLRTSPSKIPSFHEHSYATLDSFLDISDTGTTAFVGSNILDECEDAPLDVGIFDGELEEPSWFRAMVDDEQDYFAKDQFPSEPDLEIELVNGQSTYRLVGITGEGGQGRVMLAVTDADELVAVKVTHKRKAFRWDHGRPQLLQEKDIMERAIIDKRSFLMGLLSSWEDVDNVYFVMRLYPETLWDRMYVNMEPLSDTERILYCAELVVALAQLFDIRTIHRDIKADNIYIGPEGYLVLADFGLSCRSADDSFSFGRFKAFDLVGTPGYYAPEVIECDSGYTCRSDVFSMGMVFFEILSGRGGVYWNAGTAEEQWELMDTDPLKLEDIIEDEAARDLLHRMLHPIPCMRPEIRELMHHRFFAGVNFEAVERREYIHDYRPEFPCKALKPAKSLKFPSFPAAELRSNELRNIQRGNLDGKHGDFAWECPSSLRADPIHGDCYLPLP
ncbi:kinase-like domain-containing protein [Amylocystis lapponica]|nr:kinase-like domain-containing protein [Amylocystis lapponica]